MTACYSTRLYKRNKRVARKYQSTKYRSWGRAGRRIPKDRRSRGVTLKRTIRSVIRRQAEHKWLRNTTAGNVALSNAVFTTYDTLVDVPQGIDVHTRIGDKISTTSLLYQGTLTNTQVAPVWVRIACFWVGDEFGAEASAAQELFITNDNKSATAAGIVNSMGVINYKLNTRGVNVVFDRVVKLAGTGSTEAAWVGRLVVRCPLKKNINFDQALSGVENQDKRLVLMVYSTSPNGVAAAATYTYNYQHDLKVNFIDL